MLLALKEEVESGQEDVKGLHKNTIVVWGVYHNALQKSAESEKDTLRSMII